MPNPVSKAQRYAPAAAATASEAAYQVRTNIKGLLLYILPFPLVIGAIISLVAGNIGGTLLLGGSFAAYMIAATVARRGFKLEAAYQRRKIARAPKTPFKTVAAMITAVTTGVLAWLGAKYGPIESLVMTAATFLAFALSYGLDPRKDKAGNISLGVTADEIIDALDAAEIRIQSIE
ncbi:MAG TPA: 5-bromo-4-chloroindolyl phosphate hydrolysis protein, partial [Thiolinea sp.]|nr:5-bromo-4-chloroindolyl phosphate hydrolysis protein [Thiolinea sp.]